MEYNRQQSYLSNVPSLENPLSVKSQKYHKLEKEEEDKYQSQRIKFLVDHPEYDFLRNHPPLEGYTQYKSNKDQIGRQNSRYSSKNQQQNELKPNQSAERAVDNFRSIQQGGQVEVQDEVKSELSDRGVQKYYRDNSIQKLNQSMDVYQKPNNMSYSKQKTIDYSSNSPVKLPSLVQHLYNSVNLNNKVQPVARYSQDTLKERQERQKEIKQRLYQVMAPQESYYEQYNGFYHQNDYSMNINEDIIKKKLLLQSSDSQNLNSQNKLQQDNSFTNYILSNQIKDKQENPSSKDQPHNQIIDQTPIFKKNELLQDENYSQQRIIEKSLDQIRDEGDQVSTRYSQINEFNKYRMINKRSDKKEGYSTNLPSSITSSKISYMHNIPSYSFIDHVNAQLQQMRVAQQSHQLTQNNSLISSKISIQNESIPPIKKLRSITYDGQRNSPQFSQNNNFSPSKDPNISSIKDYFSKKYNNKDPTVNTEPSGKYYPRYDYSEFRMISEPNQNNSHVSQQNQRNQLRQRSSRSLLQDPNMKKRPESNNFSFQNSQTEKFHTPKQKQNQSFNAVEALQNIISDAASSNQGQPVKRKSSRRSSKAYITDREDNEDIILDVNVKNVQSNPKLSQSQTKEEEKSSSQLNNARILTNQDHNSFNQIQNQQNDSGFLNSTFNLQKELENNH